MSDAKQSAPLGLFLERLFKGECFPGGLVLKVSASQHTSFDYSTEKQCCVAVGVE